MPNTSISPIVIDGIKLATIAAGIKPKSTKQDLLLMEIDANSSIAGVFTKNAFCAAPVKICQQHLKLLDTTSPFYLLVNSGNANAGTGKSGYDNGITCCEQVASLMNSKAEQVFPFSTGVIGEALNVNAIIKALPDLKENLVADNWSAAAQAIMTTDTQQKMVSRQISIQDKLISVTGICKGSGMIHPNMATMLAYVATDICLSPDEVQDLLIEMTNVSFNRITVDGDTSTNDSCILIATGKKLAYADLDQQDKDKFKTLLKSVFVDLAKSIIIDGEGATKLITITVNGGLSQQECLDVAYTIAHSPLVKTAFFASDPNWGRILAAVGRAPVDNLQVDKIDIYLADVCIVAAGSKSCNYTEEQGQAVMNQKEISIGVDLARGSVTETIWTCDFSYDYVKINAEYRS